MYFLLKNDFQSIQYTSVEHTDSADCELWLIADLISDGYSAYVYFKRRFTHPNVQMHLFLVWSATNDCKSTFSSRPDDTIHEQNQIDNLFSFFTPQLSQ